MSVAYDVSKRYNELTYLTAHNAYEYFALSHSRYKTDVTTYLAQIQPESVPNQLTQGVRALMLDIERHDDQICLCHGWCDQRAIPLLPILQSIRSFVDRHDDAVVTIIFESRVSSEEDKVLLHQTIEAAGLADRMFDPRLSYTADVDDQGDWPPHRDNQSVSRSVDVDGWPTLQWMKIHKRDLVIFTERRDDKDGLPNIWDYAVENHWGVFSLLRWTWCRPRVESRRLDDVSRSLLILNHFPGSRLTSPLGAKLILKLHGWINNYRFIVKHVDAHHRFSEQRLPNFIAVDFFSVGGSAGSPLDVVAQINRRRHPDPGDTG